ncbi:MAG: lamin tail domain-containing protein, partial [Candidatus Poribacteria bacterium]|nr:lamin tail domain-containing protein [Candidatus Poribacteria bacterium]
PADGAASLSTTSATTDSNGEAQTTLNLGTDASGSYTVTASVGTTSTSTTVKVEIPTVSQRQQRNTNPNPGAQQATGTQQNTAQPPVNPPTQQPDAPSNGDTEPSEEDTQDEKDTQQDIQPPVQPPANNQGSGGGGGTLPKPVTSVNPTAEPFDYERTGVGRIVFSEWMLSKLNDMPQWIELYNTTNEDIDLRGWQIVGRFIDGNNNVQILQTHRLGSITIKSKETHLITAYPATVYRGSFSENMDGKTYSLQYNRQLWTGKAIVLELQDNTGNPIDRIGNLNENDEIVWKIPARTRNSVNKNRRISLIRRLRSVQSRKYNLRFGMKAFGWFPADEVEKLTESNRSKYFYGSSTDIGTPGYRTEGADPLPVRLSSFVPHVSESGVVLQWTTESELENAGFNILRSINEKGPFTKINPKLIQGAGTTSERNAYQWIDTTAKTGIEYYYRIEDMSFDGVSEVLATQRLKGVFTPKNRSLTRWAILKKATE